MCFLQCYVSYLRCLHCKLGSSANFSRATPKALFRVHLLFGAARCIQNQAWDYKKTNKKKTGGTCFWCFFCNGMYLISDAYIANWVALQVSAGQHHFNLCTWCCRATQSNIEASLINLHTWFKNMLEWVACKIQQGHSAPMQTAELPSLT